jgi:NHLM bacteriocin system ABC transporter ATP-binding protein
MSGHRDTHSVPVIVLDLPRLSPAPQKDETEAEPEKSWDDHGQRLTARAQRTRQMQDDALGALASVLHEQPTAPVPSDGPPLLLAARAVGAAMGVRIAPPARSEDLSRLKDPLEAIARASQLRLREVVLTGTWWRRDGGPLLAYLGDERCPVALLPVSPTRYDLFDPCTQTRRRVQARLAASLAPVAHLLYRPLPEEGRHASALLRFALRGHGRTVGSIVLMGVAITMLGMLLPQATALVIDYAIPDADRQAVLHIGAGLALGAVGAALFQLVQGVSLLRLEHGAAAAIQAALWDWLLRLPPTFFRRHAVGDLASRVSAIRDMRRTLSGTTFRTLFAGVTACLNLGLMLYYSASLALVACTATLVVVLVTLVAGFLTVRQVNQLKTITASVFGLLVQLLGGVAKLRVAGAEARAFAVWAQQYSQQQCLRQRVQRLADAVHVCNDIMPTITSASLFWCASLALDVGPTMAAHGFSAGTFLAFYTACGVFIGAATALSTALIDTVDLAALWQRARPILQAEPETNAHKVDPGRLSGHLALDHVSFRYQPQGRLILDDVSLHAAPGEFIALVGPSGAGKSTLYRLLLGFETPESGSITYDNQDLARLDVYAVRRQMGVVLQQARIMAASIFDNLASNRAMSMDEAMDAARAAGLAKDIARLPMGMFTMLSEGGTNLSGGQRQRLLIARALAGQPRLLLFDEATSALDNRTQALVSASLKALQVTRVVIAHRLSTIRDADRIYVLERGRIVQQGRFDALAQQEGLFARLMARQAV